MSSSMSSSESSTAGLLMIFDQQSSLRTIGSTSIVSRTTIFQQASIGPQTSLSRLKCLTPHQCGILKSTSAHWDSLTILVAVAPARKEDALEAGGLEIRAGLLRVVSTRRTFSTRATEEGRHLATRTAIVKEERGEENVKDQERYANSKTQDELARNGLVASCCGRILERTSWEKKFKIILRGRARVREKIALETYCQGWDGQKQ